MGLDPTTLCICTPRRCSSCNPSMRAGFPVQKTKAVTLCPSVSNLSTGTSTGASALAETARKVAVLSAS